MRRDVPHATARRFWRGCRCLPCRLAHAQYQRDRKLAPAVVMATSPARAHLLALKAKGVGIRQVSRLTGVSVERAWLIRKGRLREAKRTTVERLLACPVTRSGGVYVTTWWSKRHLDAMLAEGYTETQLAEWIGCPLARIRDRDLVRLDRARKIKALMRRLLDDEDDEPVWRIETSPNEQDGIHAE